MPVLLTLREGDYVVYKKDPMMYGLMTVRKVRPRRAPGNVRRVVCRVDEGRSKDLPTYEIFDVSELELPSTTG